jgi:hypothetical protein
VLGCPGTPLFERNGAGHLHFLTVTFSGVVKPVPVNEKNFVGTASKHGHPAPTLLKSCLRLWFLVDRGEHMP